MLLFASIVGSFCIPIAFVVIALSTIRLIEILGVAIDVLVFDRIRAAKNKSEHQIASYERSLILSIINYFEIILIYAILYYVAIPNGFNAAFDKESPLDSLYFSALTITTLGYGDIQPISSLAKIVSVTESAAGVFAVVLVISRMVSLVPSSPTINDSNQTGDDNSE